MVGNPQQRKFGRLVNHQSALPQLFGFYSSDWRWRSVLRNRLHVFLTESESLFGSDITHHHHGRVISRISHFKMMFQVLYGPVFYVAHPPHHWPPIGMRYKGGSP